MLEDRYISSVWSIAKLCVFGQCVLGFVLLSVQGVAQPVPASTCVDAFENDNYSGQKYSFCNGSNTQPSGWNDKISSIALPQNFKVRLCEDSGGGGQCRSYFESTPRINDAMNDRYSYIQFGGFNPEDFTIAILSDPQYGYCISDLCTDISGPRNTNTANQWHSDSIKKLENSVGFNNFGGLIINGDITHTMDRDQIQNYINDYEGKGFNIYPGLGNHDYDNYIDSKTCDGYGMLGGAYNAWSQNYCAVRLMDFFVNRVDSIPTVRWDVNIWTGYEFPQIKKRTSGSLAYSFDIGSYHFVQLNNHPSYHRSFSSYVSANVRPEIYEIKKSLDWLQNDLELSRHKKVILNLHVLNADRFTNSVSNDCNQECVDDYKQLQAILDNHPHVMAIFAGHQHEQVGHSLYNQQAKYFSNLTYEFTTSGGRKIPVFYSGAAETNRYLKVRFLSNKLEVSVVNSRNGELKFESTGSKPVDQGYQQIKNRWKSDDYIHIDNGLTSGTIASGWHSAQWVFEPVLGTKYVKIRNRWKSDQYLHTEYGTVTSSTIASGWHSAQWELESVPGTKYVKIRNRWKSDQYLHTEYGTVTSSTIASGWHSAQWELPWKPL